MSDLARKVKGVNVITVARGPLCPEELPLERLRRSLLSSMLEEGERIFLLDLRQLRALDASEFAALVKIHYAVKVQGGVVRVLGPPEQPLGNTLLNDIMRPFFGYFESEEEALASFREPVN